MSSASLTSLGMRAMFASTAALDATGHNIANANVDGYSRQRAELQTAGARATGSGFIGRGVDVATVARTHDAFLTREAAVSASLAAMDGARHAQLQRLEQTFALGEAGIGHAASQFLNAAADVANLPTDMTARQVLLSRAEELASRLRAAGAQLDTLQSGVAEELGHRVGEVNGIAAGIAQLNRQIASHGSSGHAPNDLLDERDRQLQRLASLVQVTTVTADDGSLGVFVAGGQRLVLGANAQTMSVQPDAYDPQRVAIGIADGAVVRRLPSEAFGGGSIAGLLRFQNNDLSAARNRLGQVAASLAGAVNERQSLGLDLSQPAAAGAALFAPGAARVLGSSANARDASGAFIANPTVQIVDPALLQASDYELQADPSGAPGAWQLTRRSDGAVRTVADGDTVDGFRLTLGAPPPQPGDRFLLQPVARAAHELRRVLDDPRGIAAASPVTAAVAPANVGTASVESLRVVDASIDRTLSASFAFTSDAGDYAWQLRDAGGALVGSGSGVWTAGAPIALNGFELRLAGVPKNGDAFTVSPTAFPASNNGNALALLGLRDARIVDGATVTDAWASAIADVGVRVQGAGTAADLSAAAADAAQAARSRVSGVNLDEEAARLIQFQQSYQAAAKILQVAQSLFDTLLDATN